MKAQDAVAAERRRLPRVQIEKEYVFVRDGDGVYRTYFTDQRGIEPIGSNWSLLDVTPLGRQEEWEDSPLGYLQTPPFEWWRRHDEYEG